MEYTKWDPMVKKMIIITGNRNLFPELKIPKKVTLKRLQNREERRVEFHRCNKCSRKYLRNENCYN